MLGRIVLIAAVLLPLGSTTVLAAPRHAPLWMARHACASAAYSTQCAVQIVKGNNNIALTEQSTELHNRRHHSSSQFAFTYQQGDGNRAYTGQFGGQQFSLTAQVGSNNGGFTYQSGQGQTSQTTESGNGEWSATSSIGNHTNTSSALTSF